MKSRISRIDALNVAVATGFYISYIPFWLTKNSRLASKKRWTGAGFLGTVIGWAGLYALPEASLPFGIALFVSIAAACAICGRAQHALGTHDDSRIILDETVGYWSAVAWLPRDPKLLLLGFVLFRFFDAAKLPPYRALERLPGGTGVVMDDVGAGIVTNLCLRAVCFAAPGWLI